MPLKSRTIFGTFVLAVLPLVVGAGSGFGAVFTVDTTADDDHGYPPATCPSPCTFRDAIKAANSNPGGDAIDFNVAGCGGVCTISPASALPSLTDAAGVKIDGYTQPGSRPNTSASADDAIVQIQLDGAQASSETSGIEIASGGNTIRGLIITSFPHVGILVETGAGNVISGNQSEGIDLAFYGTGNVIQGNRIGTTADGAGPLPNFNGIWTYFCNGDLIGGTALGAGNVIAYHPGRGVLVGAGPNDVSSTHESIVGNSIHDNGVLGIDLGRDGVTLNDPQDVDTGANDLQNFPVLVWAAVLPYQTVVKGTLNSTPASVFAIDIYSNDHPGNSGGPAGLHYGEGQSYLGRLSVATDGSGNASFTFLTGANIGGKYLSATATNAAGSTSELCADLAVFWVGPR